MANNDNIDASALVNLVFVRNIIDKKIKENPEFNSKKIDVIVEIIKPKHHHIVNSYSVKNVLTKFPVELTEKDKVILFAFH